MRFWLFFNKSAKLTQNTAVNGNNNNFWEQDFPTSWVPDIIST